MQQDTIKVRVRYAETDQMGVVYHGNYAQYFEMGRVEWLRNKGISYKELEMQGIMLPVVSLHMNYKKPAYYDDELSIVTTMIYLGGVKIEFNYEIFNEQGDLLTTAHTVLVFVDMKTKRPTAVPDFLMKLVNG
ncbi:thioesterase family protein [Myroides sp. JBRI-B21084]|uniref:acyl-CoA thioesterase n=1 Tax=Myroides sp. JBRI-B21084 TaxID=3119977 RepID=UPI0026E3F10B|nr:thioesterase family protein [Paenimyroides cloacae]WKW47623.1 thioesterase family protein [Paenimyroides cloacae]